MAPRWAVAALALAVVLVTARAAPTPKDGYLVPLTSNDAWDYYEFNVTRTLRTTSAQSPNVTRGVPDLTAAGSRITHMGELVNPKGEVVGILSVMRQVVGDNFNVYGLKGTRVIDSMSLMFAEFGKPEKGYYDDGIAITLVNRRSAKPKSGEDYVNYRATISGGTGRFLGAIGTVLVKALEFEKGTGVVTRSTMVYQVWVPRNLPTPKGPISGRRRAL